MRTCVGMPFALIIYNNVKFFLFHFHKFGLLRNIVCIGCVTKQRFTFEHYWSKGNTAPKDLIIFQHISTNLGAKIFRANGWKLVWTYGTHKILLKLATKPEPDMMKCIISGKVSSVCIRLMAPMERKAPQEMSCESNKAQGSAFSKIYDQVTDKNIQFSGYA